MKLRAGRVTKQATKACRQADQSRTRGVLLCAYEVWTAVRDGRSGLVPAKRNGEATPDRSQSHITPAASHTCMCGSVIDAVLAWRFACAVPQSFFQS